MSTSSGELVLIDFGLLRMWSGPDTPALDAADVGPELAAFANNAMDLLIVGPDAVAAGRSTDLAAVCGRYVLDVPADAVDRVSAEVVRRARSAGFDVAVEPITRMPHRERVARMLDDIPTGAEVNFHGITTVAVRGLPRHTELPVRGVRMPADGPDADRWRSVWVEVTPDTPVRSEDLGYVLVDEARLAFADPDALTDWRTGDSVDGLADVAFWGRDTGLLVERTGAGVLDADTHGWRDLPVEQAIARARELLQLRQSENLLFAVDYRPHDDDYRMLTPARTSVTGSASSSSPPTPAATPTATPTATPAVWPTPTAAPAEREGGRRCAGSSPAGVTARSPSSATWPPTGRCAGSG